VNIASKNSNFKVYLQNIGVLFVIEIKRKPYNLDQGVKKSYFF